MKKCKHCEQELSENKRGLVCVTCKNGLDRYNMTRLDMISMHESQNGKCKLCNKEIQLFQKYNGGYIDHDHQTDEVRGVLCHPCNTVIGYVENTGLSLEKMNNYINGSVAQLDQSN